MSGAIEAACGTCNKPWFTMNRMPNGDMVITVERSEFETIRLPNSKIQRQRRRIGGPARAYLTESPTLDGDGRRYHCNCGSAETALYPVDLAKLYEDASAVSASIAFVYPEGEAPPVAPTASFGRPAFRRGAAPTR